MSTYDDLFDDVTPETVMTLRRELEKIRDIMNKEQREYRKRYMKTLYDNYDANFPTLCKNDK
jgi:uncharacterized protein YnzC (UPF0291/DUF896 family)